MPIYAVAPDAYGSKNVRLLRALVNVALFIAAMTAAFLLVGLGTWLYHLLFVSAPPTLAAEFKKIAQPHDADVAGFVGVLLFFVLRSLSRPRKFKVLVSKDFLMIEGRWFWQREHLWRNDVEYVKETAGEGWLKWPAGLTIGNKKREFFIPAGAENYEQMKHQLSQWVAGMS